MIFLQHDQLKVETQQLEVESTIKRVESNQPEASVYVLISAMLVLKSTTLVRISRFCTQMTPILLPPAQ